MPPTSLLRDGYMIASRLDPSEIQGVRDAITDTTDRVARAMLTPYERSRPELPLEHRLQRVVQEDHGYACALLGCILADTQVDPRVARLLDHPVFRRDLEAELGPMRWTGGAVRIRANIPGLQERRQGWHSDVAFDSPFTQESTCHTVQAACWIPLMDCCESNGTLEVAKVVPKRPFLHERDSEGKFRIAESLFADAPRVALVCKKGDVAYLHRYTPHRALPNASPTIRWTAVVWLKGEGILASSSAKLRGVV